MYQTFPESTSVMFAQSLGSYPFWFLPPELATRSKLPFGFPLDFTGANLLPAGQTVQLPLAISSDADFIVGSQCGQVTSTDDTAQVTYCPILVQMNYGGSGRNFYSVPTMFNNVFGIDAGLPYQRACPYHLKGGGQLFVTLTNLDVVNDYNVRLLFDGWKVYPDEVRGLVELANQPVMLRQLLQTLSIRSR